MFVVMAIISIGYDDTTLTKVSAEIWEHSIIAKSHGARNEQSNGHTSCKQANSLERLSKALYFKLKPKVAKLQQIYLISCPSDLFLAVCLSNVLQWCDDIFQ